MIAQLLQPTTQESQVKQDDPMGESAPSAPADQLTTLKEVSRLLLSIGMTGPSNMIGSKIKDMEKQKEATPKEEVALRKKFDLADQHFVQCAAKSSAANARVEALEKQLEEARAELAKRTAEEEAAGRLRKQLLSELAQREEIPTAAPSNAPAADPLISICVDGLADTLGLRTSDLAAKAESQHRAAANDQSVDSLDDAFTPYVYAVKAAFAAVEEAIRAKGGKPRLNVIGKTQRDGEDDGVPNKKARANEDQA